MVIESIVCDGCEKVISLKTFKNGVHHSIMLEFSTNFIDSNTGMVEEVKVMNRKTHNVYCQECFEKYVKHINNFLQEVGPSLKNIGNINITGENGSLTEEALSAKKAEQNFKAVEGTKLDKATKAAFKKQNALMRGEKEPHITVSDKINIEDQSNSNSLFAFDSKFNGEENV